MRVLLAFTLLITLASCGSKKIAPTLERTVKDSVHVTTRTEITYDTIQIPADSATIKALFKKLNERPQTVRSENGRASVTLSRKLDTIYATANCALEDRIFALENKITELTRVKQEHQIITLPPVEVPFTPWYKNILAWIGGLVLAAAGITTLIKYIIPWRKS